MINVDNVVLLYRASKTMVLLFLALGRTIPWLLRAWMLYTAVGLWLFAMHSVYVLSRAARNATAA